MLSLVETELRFSWLQLSQIWTLEGERKVWYYFPSVRSLFRNLNLKN